MNKQYIFDINTIMDFVLQDDESRTSNSEITETYMQDDISNELELTSKQLREIKNNGDTSSFTLRYDLIKTFISILDEKNENDTFDFVQQITFNSLLEEGMIKEITSE